MIPCDAMAQLAEDVVQTALTKQYVAGPRVRRADSVDALPWFVGRLAHSDRGTAG